MIANQVATVRSADIFMMAAEKYSCPDVLGWGCQFLRRNCRASSFYEESWFGPVIESGSLTTDLNPTRTGSPAWSSTRRRVASLLRPRVNASSLGVAAGVTTTGFCSTIGIDLVLLRAHLMFPRFRHSQPMRLERNTRTDRGCASCAYFPPLACQVRNVAARRVVVTFPARRVGNFTPGDSTHLMRETAELCGLGGGILLCI